MSGMHGNQNRNIAIPHRLESELMMIHSNEDRFNKSNCRSIRDVDTTHSGIDIDAQTARDDHAMAKQSQPREVIIFVFLENDRKFIFQQIRWRRAGSVGCSICVACVGLEDIVLCPE